MLQSDNQFSKLRWVLTIAGLLLYVVDIWTDIGVSLKYLREQQYVWSGLTLLFVVAGLMVTQAFSYTWYCDDINDILINPEGRTTVSGLSKGGLAALHVFGMGIFTRYHQLLKTGFKLVWKKTNSYTAEEMRGKHHKLFCMATDLSMLKMFEGFVESVPQLLLQLHILLGQDKSSVLQYLSVAFSVLNVAWSLVDYRRCLRRSLPNIREMSSGLPTVIYLLYKLCTITSLILSYSLLLILSIYSTIALTILWLLGTIWTHVLQTNFCSSRSLEHLYRAVVGLILTFTFFNVKGQGTKVAMIIYYIFYAAINATAPFLLALLKPELRTTTFAQTVSSLIIGCSVLGLVCLVSYYRLLHSSSPRQEADEVDGLGPETDATRRIKKFLQP